MIAWIGAAVIGVANGILREATYGKRLDERSANQLSALSAVVALAAYFWRLHRRWPISGSAEALRIGGTWLTLTVAFEFTFGRLVAKKSWRDWRVNTTSPKVGPGPSFWPGLPRAPLW
jgi:hypothetical protein